MAEATRSALIVASDAYDDPGLGQLRAPAHDAEALARVLGDDRIGRFDVRTLFNEPAHAVTVAIEDFFADRRPDDLLLLHISSHGVKDEGGELHFATINTELRRLASTSVSAEFVNRRMSRSRSRRIVLMLDCCYAGAFERGMTARAGSGVGIEEQFGGRGRAVLTASSAMEYAFEGDQLADTGSASPSVFTTAVVEGLETGEADRDQDGRVALGELYDYVYARVRESTPNQTPSKWTFGLQGELYIANRARPVTTPTPLPIELQQILEHPLAGVRAGAVQELTRLLNGPHAGLALAARLALEKLTDDDSRTVAAAAAAALSASTAPAEAAAARSVPTEVGTERAPAGVTEPLAKTPESNGEVTDPQAGPVPAAKVGLLPDRRVRVTAGLTIAAAVILVVGLFPAFQWGDPLYQDPVRVYVIVLALVTLAAGVCLVARAPQPFLGPGPVLGVAAASVWGLFLLVDLLGEDGLGPGYGLVLLAHLLLLAAALDAIVGLVRSAGARIPRRLPTGWSAWLTIGLGVLGATFLLALSFRLRAYEEPMMATVWTACMALAVPLLATLIVPAQLGRSLLVGWIGGATAIVVVHRAWENTEEWNALHDIGGGHMVVFAATLVLLLVFGVVLRRAPETTDPPAERTSADPSAEVELTP
jgi:hypothetical protein